jgi:hypothetical protein
VGAAEEVAALWGDTDMAAAVDPERWGPARTAGELDEARFFFAVVIALRRTRLLNAHNQPSPVALALTRDRCPPFALPDAQRLAPRFSPASLRPPGFRAPAGSPPTAGTAPPSPSSPQSPPARSGPSPPGPYSPGSPGADAARRRGRTSRRG